MVRSRSITCAVSMTPSHPPMKVLAEGQIRDEVGAPHWSLFEPCRPRSAAGQPPYSRVRLRLPSRCGWSARRSRTPLLTVLGVRISAEFGDDRNLLHTHSVRGRSWLLQDTPRAADTPTTKRSALSQTIWSGSCTDASITAPPTRRSSPSPPVWKLRLDF